MTQLVVPEDLPWQDLARKVGKKYKIDMQSGEPVTGVVLDDFEHRLQHGGKALVFVDGDCMLIRKDGIERFKQQKQPVFATDIDAAALQKLIHKAIDVRKLHARKQLRIGYHHYVLRDEEDKALARMDCLVVGSKAVLNIAGLRGYEKPTNRFTDILMEAGGVPAHHDLTALLYSELDLVATAYNLKPSYGLTADMTTAEAVAKMTAVMLEVARLNEDGMVNHADDIEYLHHYRVCLRKVRSLVSLLKEIWPADDQQTLKTRLGDLARRTNALRDLDVWMQEQDYYESLIPASLAAGLPDMFKYFARQHGAAKGRVTRWINSDAYQKEIVSLISVMGDSGLAQQTDAGQQAVGALVQKKIRKRYAKIARLGLAITPETPDDDVHELRIECKKLRYLLEFFKEILDKDALSVFIKKLKKLQDNLGLFNDYSVQQESLLAFDDAQQDNAKIARTIGALVSELARRQLEQRQLVEENFALFADRESAALVAILTGRA